jgi:hypothetical protein
MADHDSDNEPDVPETEHEVDDSKLKLPTVKLADQHVSTQEENETEVYKQYVDLAGLGLWGG